MEYCSRLFRSVLYVPGSNQRALEKAKSLRADGFILDLEDAVAPDKKREARDSVADALRYGGFENRTAMVRINGHESPWYDADLDRICGAEPEAILLPKVNSGSDVRRLEIDLSRRECEAFIWAMMETPLGILNASGIASSSSRLAGFVLGTNDLAKDLGSRSLPDRSPLAASLGIALLAAKSQSLICIDGVYNAFRDSDGFARECEQGRDYGFDGKSLIHPAQIEAANLAFAPSTEELELARKQVAAHEQAERDGRGVAVLDGRIVENLHVESAKRIIAKAASISRLR
ncbi:MAG: CoA ester lyase [Albidovulum sp.]|nr:CoA ester lyase [Albidovulum sp.]